MGLWQRTWSQGWSFLLLLLLLALSAEAGCRPSINSIVAYERKVNDTSIHRTYVLCPFKAHSIGNLNFDKETISGQLMLPLRANMTVKCGDNGSRENGCFLDGGVVQVDGTDIYNQGNNNSGTEPLDNVVLQGLTFLNPVKYSARFNRPGYVSFIDCEFRDMDRTQVPVLLDYFDEESPSKELTVVFSGCLFDNIQFAGFPSNPALIVGNSVQNRIIIEYTRFINNDMITQNEKKDTNSFLIDTIGPITIRGSCFENNYVGVSPVVTFSPEYFFVRNYNFLSTGVTCELGSHFESEQQYQLFMPHCTRFDVTGITTLCPLDGHVLDSDKTGNNNSTNNSTNSILEEMRNNSTGGKETTNQVDKEPWNPAAGFEWDPASGEQRQKQTTATEGTGNKTP